MAYIAFYIILAIKKEYIYRNYKYKKFGDTYDSHAKIKRTDRTRN